MTFLLMFESLMKEHLTWFLLATGAVIALNTWRTACKDVEKEELT